MDVPLSFGDVYCVYKSISPVLAIKEYLEYEKSGVQISPIL